MKPTGRKTVKGATVSAPLSVKAATGKMSSDNSNSKVTVAAAAPSWEQIAKRAFEIYLDRGGMGGSPEGDWLLAESELSRS